MPAPLESLYQTLLPWLPSLTAAGIGMALASMIAIPWLIVRMPADYFVTDQRLMPERSLLAWLLWVARNLLAVILLAAGLLMLVLPGQGLLTILIAVAISTFPGKYRLERAIVRLPSVFRAVNWIRQRYERPPVLHPDRISDTNE